MRQLPTCHPPEDLEIIPLTDQEFEELKADLKAAEFGPRTTIDGEPTFAGAPSLIDDHAMSLYVEKVRGLVGSAEPSLPPATP